MTLSTDSPRDEAGWSPHGVVEYHLPAENVAWKAGEPVGMNPSTGIASPLAAGLLVMGVVPQGGGTNLTSYSSGAERIMCQARAYVFPQSGDFVGDTESSPYAAPMTPVFWDATNNEAVPSPAGGANAFLGFLVRAKDDDVVIVDVRPENSVAYAAQAVAGYASVRGVVAANVADLAAFTVASNDGLTYTKGQRVLLANQTTAAQNGIYVVGTVASGAAPLTRAPDMPTGAYYKNGAVIEVSEGTVFRGSSWKVMGTGALKVGTDDPAVYPRSYRKTVTLVSGTCTIGAGGGSEPLFLYSTTTSSVQATRNTAGGTLTNTTHYFAPVSGRIAGKAGTAAAVVTASVAAGTVNTADTSTVDVLVENW